LEGCGVFGMIARMRRAGLHGEGVEVNLPGGTDLVSIVIPVFNGADYLSQAIDSALAQTWAHTEVIVVDDGSDDGGRTRAVAQSYGDRIRLIAKPNGGVATALNAGMEAMRGRWFSWLSHDDLYVPGKVETQLRALCEAGGEAIAFSDFETMSADATTIATQPVTDGFDSRQPLWAVFEGRLNGCAMMLPRRMLEEAGGFDPGLPTTQDYALWFRLLRRHRILPVPGVLVRQRTHATQGSRHARHLVEAGLLWAEMAAAVTPEEMLRHAASEMAFLRRIARGPAATLYPGTAAALEACMAERLRGVRAGLVWVGDGAGAPGEGPRRGLSALATAGLAPAGAAVADASRNARSSLALRALVGPDMPILRLWPTVLSGTLMEVASQLDASIVAFTEESAPLAPAALREAAAMIEAREADGVLIADAAPAGLLPTALRGAVLSMTAIRAALAHAASPPGTDAGAALGEVARLVVLPSASPAPGASSPVGVAAATAPPVLHPPSRTELRVLRLAARLHARRPPLRGWIGPAMGRVFAPRTFDPAAYLAAYPDVRAAGADPHLHYLLHGRSEARLPFPPVAPAPRAEALLPSPPFPSPVRHDGPCRLLVLHGLGGGTRRYAELRAAQLQRTGIAPILAWGVSERDMVIEGLPGHAAPITVPLTDGTDAAVAVLRRFAIDRVEVLHTIGLDEAIVPLLAGLGRPYEVTLLDYHLVARQPHLIDATGTTAALGDAEDALGALLRPAPHPVLAGAERVLACSRDLAERVMRLVPGLDVTAARPPERPVPERFRVTPPAPLGTGEALRVLFLGDLVPHKGGETLLDTAAEAARRGLAIEFHQLGRLHAPVPPGRQSPAALRIHGGFDQEDLPRLVAAIRPHLAWFPAMAPETHGFALSDAMLLGLPILARGLGAYPDRLAGRAHSWVVAATADNTPAAWAGRLAALRGQGLAQGARLP